jgi:hypothetical protein
MGPRLREDALQSYQSGRLEMDMHKFKVGQTVFLQPTIANRIVERHPYEVTKQLPVQSDGQIHYRIKCSSEPYERVANESELSLD